LPMDSKLSREARSAALARLAGWQEVGGRDAITKTFVFADFNERSGS
jgi:4a-hydroxytetrahydrobiopterin dehydratase